MNMVFEKTLCFTGHRPNKLASYDYQHPDNLKMLRRLKALIIRFIERRGVTTFISGMALGIDMWSAQIVLSLKEKYPQIKLVCAIPCANHPAKWNEKDQQLHKEICEQADYVYYVSEEPYTNWCMIKRDEWMVNESRFVIAVWNGEEAKHSGTWHTVKYAKKRQRNIVQLHPQTLEIGFIK
jgi:uncharacterized phage-like protein YoqJ